ncbi:tetratricopeptide repeat protein 19, mitochondrial [Lingula anatina]|uniref:Tetratricopeptide repeat protein 19, mitochondrial n=1 Tax=Lingula anatina TaxID=7574 RepID=A0A1S3IVU8_LINAN|nr:tetratricopeptide repeat protein 19, mitochondrial [Lingula anatina]|eukprot:XP_013402317.1 tetratricopeptide repeat protein 19, mitochondrial [Lingula anatina]
MAASLKREVFSKLLFIWRSVNSKVSQQCVSRFQTKQTIIKNIGSSYKLSCQWSYKHRNYQGELPRVSLVALFPVSLAAAKNAEEEKDQNETELVMILRKGIQAQNKSDYKAADEFYHEALHFVYKLHREGKIDDKRLLHLQTNIFDKMANLGLLKGEFDHAEVLFKDTMKGMLQMGLDKTDNALVEISVKLASIYASKQKFDDAELGYQFCVDTMAKKTKEQGLDADLDTTLLYGLCLESQARFWVYQKEYEKALENYHLALDIAAKYLPLDHPQKLVIMNDVSSLYYLKGDMTTAEKYMEEALDVAEVTQVPELPQFYCNQGLIFAQLGRFDEAETSCRKALKVAKDRDDQESVKEALDCLADVRKMKNSVK